MNPPWDPDRQDRADLWALVRQLGADLTALGRLVWDLAARVAALERDRDDD